MKMIWGCQNWGPCWNHTFPSVGFQDFAAGFISLRPWPSDSMCLIHTARLEGYGIPTIMFTQVLYSFAKFASRIYTFWIFHDTECIMCICIPGSHDVALRFFCTSEPQLDRPCCAAWVQLAVIGGHLSVTRRSRSMVLVLVDLSCGESAQVSGWKRCRLREGLICRAISHFHGESLWLKVEMSTEQAWNASGIVGEWFRWWWTLKFTFGTLGITWLPRSPVSCRSSSSWSRPLAPSAPMPCQRLVCPQDDQEITRKRPPKDKVLPWQELSVDDEDLRNRQLAGFEDVKGQNTQKVDEEQACEVSSSSTSPTTSPKTSVPAKMNAVQRMRCLLRR